MKNYLDKYIEGFIKTNSTMGNIIDFVYSLRRQRYGYLSNVIVKPFHERTIYETFFPNKDSFNKINIRYLCDLKEKFLHRNLNAYLGLISNCYAFRKRKLLKRTLVKIIKRETDFSDFLKVHITHDGDEKYKDVMIKAKKIDKDTLKYFWVEKIYESEIVVKYQPYINFKKLFFIVHPELEILTKPNCFSFYKILWNRFRNYEMLCDKEAIRYRKNTFKNLGFDIYDIVPKMIARRARHLNKKREIERLIEENKQKKIMIEEQRKLQEFKETMEIPEVKKTC